jgi:hypothetical protein
MKVTTTATIVVRDVDVARSVFRIVRSDTYSSVRDSMRSNYELGRVPRGVEVSWPVVQMGISVFLTSTAAREVARKFPKLGTYIAELALAPGQGFNVAETGQPLHLTTWADPVKLRDAVVDVEAI